MRGYNIHKYSIQNMEVSACKGAFSLQLFQRKTLLFRGVLMSRREVVMNKKTGSVLKVITLLTALLCIGWADDWEGIRAASGKLTSISADFVQEKHMKILSRPLVSRGVFHYQNPASLRWEYQSPIQSILLMHNGKTKRYVQGAQGLIEDSGHIFSPCKSFFKKSPGFWAAGLTTIRHLTPALNRDERLC